MIREATLSPDGIYRYSLTRRWASPNGPHLYFVMLNPSTANADVDDPTIRKCLGFAMRANYTGFTVLNLFAFRATDPKDLHFHHGASMAVGSDNDRHLGKVPFNADVCFAWGANARRYPERVAKVKFLLGGTRWLCLKRLADGTPAHPLMLPYSCKLTEYGE